MGCPPVRGDNPRALASGLSYLQVDKHGITFFCTTYTSLGIAHHEIFHAKFGKGGIRRCPSKQLLTTHDEHPTITASGPSELTRAKERVSAKIAASLHSNDNA